MRRQHEAPRTDAPLHLEGLVTEADLELAELEFPGIQGFYRTMAQAAQQPRTFLELLQRFGAFSAPAQG